MFVISAGGSDGFFGVSVKFYRALLKKQGVICNVWMFVGATTGHWRSAVTCPRCVFLVTLVPTALCHATTVFLQRWQVPVGHPIMMLGLHLPRAGYTHVTPSDPGFCVVAAPAPSPSSAWSNSCGVDSWVHELPDRFVSWWWLKGLLYSEAAGI